MNSQTRPAAERTSLEELRAFSPLDGLDSSSLSTIAQRSQRLRCSFGTVLFREGTSNEKTLYLCSGTVERSRANVSMERLVAGTMEARYPLSRDAVHRTTATAMSESVELLSIDSEVLDLLVTWDQTGSYRVVDLLSAGNSFAPDDWMTHVLQSKIVQRMPAVNIQALFMRLQKMEMRSGQTVIKQGSEGDYFYIVVKGRCVVKREVASGGAPLVLCELGVGEGFGEEALLSGGRRNATVEMATDGALARVEKAEFLRLCSTPIVREVGLDEAQEIVRKGGCWLDVRLPSEVAANGIRSSLNVPLYLLRRKALLLPAGRRLIAFCDTGRRSSAAAFILSSQGIDVVVLRGGLRAVAEHAPLAGRMP